MSKSKNPFFSAHGPTSENPDQAQKCLYENPGCNGYPSDDVCMQCVSHAHLASNQAAFVSHELHEGPACPKCREELILTAHGAYCPKSTCKYGWEVELDGSPLKSPLAAPQPPSVQEPEPRGARIELEQRAEDFNDGWINGLVRIHMADFVESETPRILAARDALAKKEVEAAKKETLWKATKLVCSMCNSNSYFADPAKDEDGVWVHDMGYRSGQVGVRYEICPAGPIQELLAGEAGDKKSEGAV
jgi:hypothetical protein